MQKSVSLNNFDFLRLVTAYLVLFSHQFPLSGQPSLSLGDQSLDKVRVLIFFSISGYLIAQSWDRDPSVWRFLAKRVLRIWPGLIVVTMVTALLLGPIISTIPADQYFLNSKTWEFFYILKLNIRYELPGVFSANPFPNAVNGSLWTLPIEFRWYLILLALSVVGLVRCRLLLLIGAIALAIFVFVIHDPQHAAHRKYSLEFGAFFCYGVCLYYFRDFWATRKGLVLLVLVLSGVTLFSIGQKYAALFVVLPTLVIFFGTASTPFIRRAGRFGDFSYGIYIYAFPVQQTVIWLTDNRLSIWSELAASTAITIALAILSWHCIERPALRLKRHFIRSQKSNRYFSVKQSV